MSPSDITSAAARLALKGSCFATSEEVAAAIEGGLAAELAFAVMAALGSRFEQLADEDQVTIAELYTAAPSAATMVADAAAAPKGPNTLAEREEYSPLSSLETGGDEAAGSPATSVIADEAEKGPLSSPEDDSINDESPSGDARATSVELPVDSSSPPWQEFARQPKPSANDGRRLTPLACRFKRLTLGIGPEVPAHGPVRTPGQTGTDLARPAPKGAKRYGVIVPNDAVAQPG